MSAAVGRSRVFPQINMPRRFARWLGIAEADLAGVAPHLGNFAGRDLGFLT